MNIPDRKFTLQEISQLFLDWCNQPETFFQRKSMVVKSKVAGVPDKTLLGAGLITFVTDFPQFCQDFAVAEAKGELVPEKKCLPDKIDLEAGKTDSPENENGNEEKPEEKPAEENKS